ncbi:MAG: hypothetical protein AYK18_13500 [Theionarchaea archaeon DG-70]|nr:MAG: hypothetical protein AYK18_13500 [Theionarchaea archaeon DG-70]
MIKFKRIRGKTNPSAFNIFQGGIFPSSLRFSSIYDLIDPVEPFFRSIPFDKEEAIEIINKMINKLETDFDTIGQKEAFFLIFLDDILKIREKILETSFLGLEDRILKDFESMVSSLSKIGIEITDCPDIFFVDQYPHPFDEMIWLAASIFPEDERNYGAKSGIYFRNDKIVPYLSTSLAGHELMHFVMEEDHKILPTRLEEGICDLVGSLYLTLQIHDPDTSKNIMRNNLFSYPSEEIWNLYAYNLKQAGLIYKEYGLRGICWLVNQNNRSSKIKAVERKLLKGRIPELGIESGNFDEDLTAILNELIGFPLNLVVSPLAYYSACNIEIGISSLDIIKDLNLYKDEALEAFNELEFMFPLIARKDNIIMDEIIKNYIDLNVLRYRIDRKWIEELIRDIIDKRGLRK